MKSIQGVEGNIYYTPAGERYLVVDGAFQRWSDYLEKHPEVDGGSFQCKRTGEEEAGALQSVAKGIYKILTPA